MDFIEKNLGIIAWCIQNQTYQEVETERFEVKDLSASGNNELSAREIEEYEELKLEQISSQELSAVKGAGIDLINIDKLNDYILRLNKRQKIESIKADVPSALSFLERKSFTRNGVPTLLGMLVCGDYVADYIQGKCDVNCTVDFPSPNAAALADDKQRYQDNIIPLIEQGFSFIWRHISVGLAYANGGTAAPEYPEDLIREMLNNALAHRNYASSRPVMIRIKPHQHLMVQNPGKFAHSQILHIDTAAGKIRRIIRKQISRNPKLTNLLYSFDRFEGAGNGLASVVNACLENKIDVPYYTLLDGEIRLFVPKGKVLDEEMESWMGGFSGYIQRKAGRELTNDEKIMLSFVYKSEKLNRVESYTILLTMDNNHKAVIATLEEKALIFKNPESPDLYPVYQADRTLLQTEFSEELKQLFGAEWEKLKPDYAQVLNAVYGHNAYGDVREGVSANRIGAYLFFMKGQNSQPSSDYENYKRNIRNIFNRLEDKGFIVRRDGKTKKEGGKPDFIINEHYQEPQSLFSL